MIPGFLVITEDLTRTGVYLSMNFKNRMKLFVGPVCGCKELPYDVIKVAIKVTRLI